MATISRCLCLFLTLWMAGSKRPAVPWTVASDPWWGTQEAFEIKRAGERLRGARDFAGAEAIDRSAYDFARQRHDDGAAFVNVTAIGAARLFQFHYRSALNAFLEVRDLAARIGDPFALSIRYGQLQLALTEMEAKAGLGSLTNKFANKFENFRGRTSLIHFQQGLSKSELLLKRVSRVSRGTRVMPVGGDSNDAEHASAAGGEGDPERGQAVSRGGTSRRRSGRKIKGEW
jgi:hypothetical protein